MHMLHIEYVDDDRTCLFVNLVRLIRQGRLGLQTRREFLGRLGSLNLPITEAGRERFWRKLPEHFQNIEAAHPGRVTADDKANAVLSIAARIPRHIQLAWTSEAYRSPKLDLVAAPLELVPALTDEEWRKRTIVDIQDELTAGLDRLDGADAAIATAVSRLRVLRRTTQTIERRRA
jgi:hypothetical protein